MMDWQTDELTQYGSNIQADMLYNVQKSWELIFKNPPNHFGKNAHSPLEKGWIEFTISFHEIANFF